MLMTVVLVPESLSARHFSDPSYHLHTETLLRGVDANGLILVDKNDNIYTRLCDTVESLAATKKGKSTHALFEELLKKQRQKVVRFVATKCPSSPSDSPGGICATIAERFDADLLVNEPGNELRQSTEGDGYVRVVPMAEYLTCDVELERRRCFEALPSLDRMRPGEFDRLMVGATKYSRWLRFYDKQIGKATNLSRFRKGIEKILNLWISNAHFDKDELSVELFTVVDASLSRRFDSSEAYGKVKAGVIDPISTHFNIPIALHFKQDLEGICHARHLQTQSLAIMFERGFDFIQDDGSFCRTFIKPDATCGPHLQEYRKLIEFKPPST